MSADLQNIEFVALVENSENYRMKHDSNDGVVIDISAATTDIAVVTTDANESLGPVTESASVPSMSSASCVSQTPLCTSVTDSTSGVTKPTVSCTSATASISEATKVTISECSSVRKSSVPEIAGINIVSSGLASSSGVLKKRTELDYSYFPGKINFKRKTTAQRQTQYVVSGVKFRKAKAERTMKQKKKNEGDWFCIYCEVSYSADRKNKKNVKWVECDQCTLQMHVPCVPKRHLVSMQFNEEEDDNEVDFKCEFCVK